MKRLDEMEFVEVSSLYQKIFSNLIDITTIEKRYKELYSNYIDLINSGKKLKGGTLGRGELKYGRNIIYGWFLEEIVKRALLLNDSILSVNLFGDDKSHRIVENDNKIEISGSKSTTPDFLIELKSGQKLLLELKSAAREVFTIKKSNVKALSKEAGFQKIPTSIMMIDLVNATYDIKDLKYFISLKPFVNQRMEGQLCYDFPRPTKEIKYLIKDDFQNYVDMEIFSFEIVKKYILLSKAQEMNLKKFKTIINQKIRLEELQEQMELSYEEFQNKIKKIQAKYPQTLKSWEEIEKELNQILKDK